MTDSILNTPETGKALEEMHERLGISSDDCLSFGYRQPGSNFLGHVERAETLQRRTFPDDQDCWASINPVRSDASGRGKASDVTRLVGLFADLDLKPGCFETQTQMFEVTSDVSAVLNHVNPAVIIQSGAGHQPIWAVEDGDTLSNAEAAALLKRFGLLVQVVANAHGAKVDSVFDLPRVLRIPGTNNMKYNPPRPASAIFPPQRWRPLSVSEIIDALDAHGIADVDPTTSQAVTLSEVDDWEWGDKTCSYVTQMIDGWNSASPDYGRHQWAGSQCIRLVSAYRLGCITEEDFSRGYQVIDGRLRHMREHGIAGTKQKTPKEEMPSWMLEAKRVVQLKTDEQVAHELGDHEHENLALKADEEWLVAGVATANEQLREQRELEAARLQSEQESSMWDRPLLAHVKQCADARGASKYAVLMAFLARFSTQIRPNIMLPALVGDTASLNLYVAIVGLPGAGKSAAVGVAEGMANWGAKKIGAGSGEGLLEAMGRYDDNEKKWVQKEEAVLIEIDEISTMMSQNDRGGNTFIDLLTNGWLGAFLNTPYADARKNRELKRHKYRISMVIGAQPGKIDGLMAHKDSGFPQRFVWVDAADRDIPRPENRPDHPGLCHPPFLGSTAGRPEHMTFPHHIATEIQEAQYARATQVDWESTQTFDKGAHWYMARMKVSALLALLDSRMDVSEEDWAISDFLMNRSDATLERLEHFQRERKHLTYRGQAQEAVTVADLTAEYTIKRVAGVVARHVNRHSGADGCTMHCIGSSVKSTDRSHKDDAVQYALEAGWIKPASKDSHYVTGPENPA